MVLLLLVVVRTDRMAQVGHDELPTDVRCGEA